MKYDINLENVQQIIHSDTVPENDGNGLVFDLDTFEVTIKKPYIDKDGDEMGNSIYVDFNDGRVFSFRIQDSKYLFVFYRANDQESFQTLGDDSPKPVVDLALQVWKQITDDMAERENAWNGVGQDLKWDKFTEQFGTHEVPDLLRRLFFFQEMKGAESFSESFYLYYFDKAGLKTWSEKESFTGAFIEFATANGTGSSYAFWVTDKDLAKCPIIVFGDEGGVHVIAENLVQLIHLLTFDTEISVSWEDAYFYRDEDEYEESSDRKAFLQWVKSNTGLNPLRTAEETEEIVQAAKEQHQAALNKFLTDNGIEL